MPSLRSMPWPLAPALAGCLLALVSCGESNRSAPVDRSRMAAARLAGDGDRDRAAALVRERAKADVDGDADNEGSGRYDWDDSNVFYYGHLASVKDGTAIDAVVGRYYAAAARADGPAACRLISRRALAAMRREVEQALGFLAPRGHTCGAILSALLSRLHANFDGGAPTLGLARVEGHSAYVPVAFAGSAAHRFTVVRREGDVWKMDVLFDEGLP